MTLRHFKVGLGAAAVSLAIAVPSAFAVSSLIYVTNSAGDNVHVIDSATNKVVQVIKGIEASHGVAFSPDGKTVYDFDEESGGGRELLGGKGVGLADMTLMGLPVPAGFTVTTDACRAYMRAGAFPVGLADELAALKLDTDLRSIGENLRTCYHKLVSMELVGKQELGLVDAWLNDLQQLGSL